MRNELRKFAVSDDELGAVLTVLGSIGRRAFQALADAVYSGEWSEARFQNDLRGHLRNDRLIGSELDEHGQAGGGIVDLSFKKTRIELKVDDHGDVSVNTVVERYGQQTAQYAVASDRRCCVLAVLDTKKRMTAPGQLSNDIGVRLIHPPEDKGGRGVLIAVIILRGNLARPSDLSK